MRAFERALLIGCPSPEWPKQLRSIANHIEVCDPGELFAQHAGGFAVQEDRHDFGEQRFDLCLAVGTLDTVNDLPVALQLIRRSLRPDAPLIGAIAGSNSLPALRSAMIEAGRSSGRVAPRTHPRIDPSTLAQLLTAAGFAMPVVDVDRVKLRYARLDDLIRDLRAMGATAVLAERPAPLTRTEALCAQAAFRDLGTDGRTEETVEILHFLGWNQ